MNEMKTIIIVCTDDYKDIARQLSNEIAKRPEFDSVLWSVEDYEMRESKITGRDYALFIGNESENRLTKSFLPVIKNLRSKAGVCYGFDGSKAVIFGAGKLPEKKEFEELK